MKSRRARSASIPLAAQAGDVDLPAAPGGDDAPGPELGRELEGVLAELASDRLGRGAGVAGDGEVEVVDRAAEGGVADGAAGDPGLGAGERAGRRRRQRLGAEVVGEAHAAARRGTRGETPQVIS